MTSNADLALRAVEGLRMLLTSATPAAPLPPERDLSGRFGVSRRVIRQALSTFEAEGRIWRRQGKGTFVGPAPSVELPTLNRMAARTNLFEVMEVRLSIEPRLAQLAAERATTEQIALMRRLAQSHAERTGAPAADLEAWDGALHRCIAEAAGNRLLLDLFDMVDRIRRDATWQSYREKARTPASLAGVAAEHLGLVEAIGRRDGSEAARLMGLHVEALRKALLEAVEHD